MLLVSPERLANPGFGRRVLDGLAGRLGLLVIDEAHAVSDWGHDFRPDYRRVSDVLQRLNPSTPVLATTATANAAGHRRRRRPARRRRPWCCAGRWRATACSSSVVDRLSPLERYAWVVDHLPRLPGSGIVYTLTVADAERLAAAIRERARRRGAGRRLHRPARRRPSGERLEDALRANRLKALVATSALGMGYDKPDLGFVVHVGSPPSPVSYYQQVGRAGRGIDHAHASCCCPPTPTPASGTTSPRPRSRCPSRCERCSTVLDRLAGRAAASVAAAGGAVRAYAAGGSS